MAMPPRPMSSSTRYPARRSPMLGSPGAGACASSLTAPPAQPTVRVILASPDNLRRQAHRGTPPRCACRGAAPARLVVYDQRDRGTRQALADRAGVLGILRDLGELLWRDAVGRAADLERDAADPEAARRVGAEGDIRANVEGLPGAPRLAQQRGELHGKTCRVRRGDELLRAGHPASVVRGPARETDLVAADAGTDQRYRAGPVLKAAGPCGAGGAGRHRSSFLPDDLAGPAAGAAASSQLATAGPAGPGRRARYMPGIGARAGATVDRQGGAGDERGLVAEQERHRGGDLGRAG